MVYVSIFLRIRLRLTLDTHILYTFGRENHSSYSFFDQFSPFRFRTLPFIYTYILYILYHTSFPLLFISIAKFNKTYHNSQGQKNIHYQIYPISVIFFCDTHFYLFCYFFFVLFLRLRISSTPFTLLQYVIYQIYDFAHGNKYATTEVEFMSNSWYIPWFHTVFGENLALCGTNVITDLYHVHTPRPSHREAENVVYTTKHIQHKCSFNCGVYFFS